MRALCKNTLKIILNWNRGLHTNGLIKSIKHVINNKNNSNKNSQTKKKYRNRWNNFINVLKNGYYKDKIGNANGDYKKIWGIVNEASNTNINSAKQKYQIENSKGKILMVQSHLESKK